MRLKLEKDIDDALTLLSNRTFDELSVGDSARFSHVLSRTDIELFAAVSGDINPAHLDPAFAEKGQFHSIIGHGMWGGALISAVLGTQLPGPGTIYLGQDLRFRRPVRPGDTITAEVTVRELRPEKRIALLDCRCVNQFGENVITGTAEVLAPREKVTWPAVELPSASVHHHGHDPLDLARQCLWPGGIWSGPAVWGILHPAFRRGTRGLRCGWGHSFSGSQRSRHLLALQVSRQSTRAIGR